MQLNPRLGLCFKCIKGALKLWTEILVVSAPHDGPVDPQADLKEDENVGGDVEDNGRRFVPHWQARAAEQAHEENNDSNDHQRHR